MPNCLDCLYYDRTEDICMHKDKMICKSVKNHPQWSPIPKDKLSPSLRRLVVNKAPIESPSLLSAEELSDLLLVSQDYVRELSEANSHLTAENTRLRKVAEAARLLLNFTDSPNGIVGFTPCQSLDRLQQALAEVDKEGER